jgi:hypothetical protein
MAGINQYSSAVGNTLEQYVPLPLDQLFKAGQTIQTRGDAAQQQNDTIQTGLASMEALAPTHRDFVNKFVGSFKDQQGALLDKYHGNTSDLDYEREARRLNMQYAADPKLQIIKQANEQIRVKEALKDKLDSNGVKYLDSNPTYTGTDANGNLSANVGQLRATDFDNQIDQAFKSKEGAIEQVGTKLTNARNLHREYATLLNGMNNGTDSRMMEGLQYYKQKGYSDDQAKAQMIQHLNAGLAYTHDLKDHFYDQLEWDKFKFNAEQKAKIKQEVAPGILDSTQSPFVAEKLGADKLNKIDQIIKNTNEAGGIKKGQNFINDTPENRASLLKKGQKFQSFNQVDPDALGTEGGTTSKLQVEGGYNPEESHMIDEARGILGNAALNAQGKPLSDKTVLTAYKNALTKSQAAAYQYHAPLNTKYSGALTTLEFGKNLEHLGTDYMVITKDGKYKAGSKEANAALKDVKDVSATGINAAPLGNFVNGTVAAEGVDKNRNTVTIIKPMSPAIASHYRFSNTASKALLSDFTNEQFESDPATDDLKIQSRDGSILVPQRGLTREGKIGIAYYPLINGKVDRTTKPIDISGMEQGEHSNFFSKLGQSINTKAEDQNYQ